MTTKNDTKVKTFPGHEGKDQPEITARVQPLGAKKGRRLLVKLSRIIAPALGAMVGSGAVVDLGAARLERMATLLSSHMHEDDVDDLLAQMLPQTHLKKNAESDFVQATEAIFDIVFVNRYMDQFKFLAFCLEVNYSDFLDEIKASGAAAAFLKPEEASPSPRV